MDIESFDGRELRAGRERKMNRRTAVAQERAQLLSVAEIARMAVPSQPVMVGVYFLLLAGEVVYVGRAVNIAARLAAHVRGGKAFDAWAWLECAADEQTALERAYIDAIMPEYNRDSATRKARGDDAWCWAAAGVDVDLGLMGGTPPLPEDAITENHVWSERMRRLRMMKANAALGPDDFGPVPRATV